MFFARALHATASSSENHGPLHWDCPAGPRGSFCGSGVPGTSHGSQRGGGRPSGGHRGGAGALGGAAAGPRLRQRGGDAAELAGGRHLPGADLRRGLCGGLGQPPHQAPHGGEGRGGFLEVSEAAPSLERFWLRLARTRVCVLLEGALPT
ncbi:unnamed protein product, partial [Effrenium voratum]